MILPGNPIHAFERLLNILTAVFGEIIMPITPGDPIRAFERLLNILTAVFGEIIGPIIFIGLVLALVWKVVQGIKDTLDP